jgi:hypothetical protein
MGDEGKGSENVEIVKRLLRAFDERDNETPFEYYAEGIVWDASDVDFVDMGGVYTGHDDVRLSGAIGSGPGRSSTGSTESRSSSPMDGYGY